MAIFFQNTIDITGLQRFANQTVSDQLTYTYHINLDERGMFYADVRDTSGNTVFEIKIDESDEDNNIFTDGFMRHKHDMSGLKEYLVSLDIIKPMARLVDQNKTRVASVCGGKRIVKMAICTDPLMLVGGVNDARLSIIRNGFDPRTMLIVSYDQDSILAEPEFPTDSRLAIAAHTSRCRVILGSMDEAGNAPSTVDFIIDHLGNGSPSKGWDILRRYAINNEGGML
jgi:hypothetical protein